MLAEFPETSGIIDFGSQCRARYIFVMISGLADMGAEALGRDTKGCAFVGDALRAVCSRVTACMKFRFLREHDLRRTTCADHLINPRQPLVTVFARFKKLKLQQTWNNIHLAKDPTRPSSSKYDSGGGEMIEALFLLKN
ncbi:hypothetical protein M0657_004672 [Pyricularia oryzae]|uniref:Uncharacterized protein n=1 Tax=Pyricularia oryzae TaxID=318829 RepID=A0A4V1C5H9_PYROR|nr:hypothetical protein M9X92_005104 [Pyricularia oryzae]KAI7924327.1 hypothetical protein M0657_004672 [Pyricularia oryzae]QBZ56445.1 hypothetical protein PoMZ_01352 [Pyricularia oryzae]